MNTLALVEGETGSSSPNNTLNSVIGLVRAPAHLEVVPSPAPLADGPKDLVVDSGGVELAVRDFRGSDPAIILLHGIGRSLIDWQLIAPLLSVDCHAFSTRGILKRP